MNQKIPLLSMTQVRAAIDRIDDQLVDLIAERQRWIETAIEVKKRDGVAARVPERVEQVLARTMERARQNGADERLVARIWTEMMEWLIAHEEKFLPAPARKV